MKKSIIILFLLITSVVFAQIPPQLAPDGLETKFVSIDTLTTTQRDALTVTGAKGTIIFNSTTQSYEGYNPITTLWGAIGSGGSVVLPNREIAYGDATGTGLTSHPNIQAYGSSGWIKLNDGSDNYSNLYSNRLESRNVNDYSALFYNLLRHHNTTDGSMYIRPSAGYTDQVTLFYPPLTANDTIATLSDLTGQDYSEWATYTGTRDGTDLVTTLGNYNTNKTQLKINDSGAWLNIYADALNGLETNYRFLLYQTRGSALTTQFQNQNITSSNILQVPDASGTIALTSDLTGNDYSQWATYTGTRVGGDLLTTIGDFDDAGNGTKIIIDDDGAIGANGLTSILSTGKGILIYGNPSITEVTSSSGLRAVGGLGIEDVPGGLNVATIKGTNITGLKDYELPNTSGTIALTSDITGGAYSETFGNGVLTTIPITHNLGTEDIASVRIVDIATKETIQTTQIGVDANTINLIFATAPTTNQYRVTIKK